MAGPVAVIGGGRGSRFSGRSVQERWYWNDSGDVAGSNPTRVEMDAGTDLTPGVSAASGFTESSQTADTPDLIDFVTTKILDAVSLENGQITFYADTSGADAASFFTRGQTGYVHHLPYGDSAGKKYDSFTVQVGSVSPGTEIGGAKVIVVDFIVSDVQRGLTLPA